MILKPLFLCFSLSTISQEVLELKTVQEAIDARWSFFQSSRTFEPFQPDRSDASLTEEFQRIREVRSHVWTTPGFELAQHLVDADLIRAPGCVAFDYNNTTPYYN